jgi:hypothetical protein
MATSHFWDPGQHRVSGVGTPRHDRAQPTKCPCVRRWCVQGAAALALAARVRQRRGVRAAAVAATPAARSGRHRARHSTRATIATAWMQGLAAAGACVLALLPLAADGPQGALSTAAAVCPAAGAPTAPAAAALSHNQRMRHTQAAGGGGPHTAREGRPRLRHLCARPRARCACVAQCGLCDRRASVADMRAWRWRRRCAACALRLPVPLCVASQPSPRPAHVPRSQTHGTPQHAHVRAHTRAGGGPLPAGASFFAERLERADHHRGLGECVCACVWWWRLGVSGRAWLCVCVVVVVAAVVVVGWGGFCCNRHCVVCWAGVLFFAAYWSAVHHARAPPPSLPRRTARRRRASHDAARGPRRRRARAGVAAAGPRAPRARAPARVGFLRPLGPRPRPRRRRRRRRRRAWRQVWRRRRRRRGRALAARARRRQQPARRRRGPGAHQEPRAAAVLHISGAERAQRVCMAACVCVCMYVCVYVFQPWLVADRAVL